MSLSTRWAAAAVAISLAFTLAGCVGSPAPGVICEFGVQNPHQSSGSPRYMDGKATMVCTGGSVTNAQATIKLQRLRNGTWSDVANSTASRSATTLQSGQKFTITTRNGLVCANGTYRTAVRGSATFNGQPNASASWQYSAAAAVVCR